MDQAREGQPVSRHESLMVYRELADEIDELGPDDVESTAEAPAVTEREAEEVLSRVRIKGPPSTRARRLVAGLGGAVLLTFASCSTSGCVDGKLLPATEAAIDAAELDLCEGVAAALDPPLAVACPGSEALLERALDHVTAHPDASADAGLGTAVAAVVTAPASPPTVPLIKSRRGYAVFYRHRHLGWAPRSVALAINCASTASFLDAQADAGPT